MPTPTEFTSNGIAFLNLAWELIISHSLDLAESESEEFGGGGDLTEDEKKELHAKYWKRAQHSLSVAVALIQQGTEFLLKGKIAAVSPYLLIIDEPTRWPSGCDKQDKSFADFKTLDAQDLIRAHDTVCDLMLPDKFKGEFEKLRKLRNTVMHSVDKRNSFTARDGVIAVLEISDVLIGQRAWHEHRAEYFHGKMDYWYEMYPYADFNPNSSLARETIHVLDDLGLTPSEIKKYYRFNPKQRRYLCPGCRDSQAGIQYHLAQLDPNSPASTQVYCVSCREHFPVSRQDCSEPDCRGNVYDEEWGECLTCGK